MNLLTVFDRTEIVNLPERRDRRRQTERELRRQFPAADIDERVRFFRAIRPETAGPFQNRGVHGAFLSTLEILRSAAADDLGAVLMMQDDVRFTKTYREAAPALLAELDHDRWDLVQLGYHDPWGSTTPPPPGSPPTFVELTGPVIGAHCIGFRRSVYQPLIEHLETVLGGTPGDDLRGPMPIDGAFNTFVQCTPGIRRLAPVPSLVGQRSSRSDIRPKRHDRIPALRPVLDAGRVGLERLRDLRR